MPPNGLQGGPQTPSPRKPAKYLVPDGAAINPAGPPETGKTYQDIPTEAEGARERT